jgi:hypothetical protein
MQIHEKSGSSDGTPVGRPGPHHFVILVKVHPAMPAKAGIQAVFPGFRLKGLPE